MCTHGKVVKKTQCHSKWLWNCGGMGWERLQVVNVSQAPPCDHDVVKDWKARERDMTRNRNR